MKTYPGFRNQVHEETSPHRLLGVRDQRLGVERDQLPRGLTGNRGGNTRTSGMSRIIKGRGQMPTGQMLTGQMLTGKVLFPDRSSQLKC